MKSSLKVLSLLAVVALPLAAFAQQQGFGPGGPPGQGGPGPGGWHPPGNFQHHNFGQHGQWNPQWGQGGPGGQGGQQAQQAYQQLLADFNTLQADEATLETNYTSCTTEVVTLEANVPAPPAGTTVAAYSCTLTTTTTGTGGGAATYTSYVAITTDATSTTATNYAIGMCNDASGFAKTVTNANPGNNPACVDLSLGASLTPCTQVSVPTTQLTPAP